MPNAPACMVSTSCFKRPEPLPLPVLDFVVSVLLELEDELEGLFLEQATVEATIHATITHLEKIMRFMFFSIKVLSLYMPFRAGK